MFHMKSVLKHRLFLSFRSDSLSLLLCFMAFMGVEQSGFMGVVYCLFSGPSVCVCVCVCLCVYVCVFFYLLCMYLFYLQAAFSLCLCLFIFSFYGPFKCLLFLCFTLCVSILSVSLYVLFHSLLPFLIVIVVDPFARWLKLSDK